MQSIPFLKKQVLILFIFSILVVIASIIHGIFMDLDFTQIKRLTIEGFVLTLFVVFPAILFLEWVFDLNNKEELDKIKKKLRKN